MRSIRFGNIPTYLLLTLATLCSAVAAQSSMNGSEWGTLRPASEEFSISMPKNPTIETEKVPYHKMELSSHLYLSNIQGSSVFAVASLSGIKSNPALYSEMQRLNSYVDAFKNWFPPKVRGKGAVAKIALVGDKTLNGHAGREYKLTIGDLTGTAQFYATRKRFYAVVALNTKKDDSFEERFLSSFLLPDNVPEPAAAVAAQSAVKPEEVQAPADVQVKQPPAPSTEVVPEPEADVKQAADAKPADPNAQSAQSGQKAPISGGVLNGKAISLPRPDYPPDARAARASGTVVIQVIIDEQGSVISAKPVSGHQLLQQASINAALQAKFSPTFLLGEPVKVTGVITYNFVQQ